MNDSDKGFLAVLLAVSASLTGSRYNAYMIIYGATMELMPDINEIKARRELEVLVELLGTGGILALQSKSSDVDVGLRKQCFCYGYEIALKHGAISNTTQSILDKLQVDWSITDDFKIKIINVLIEKIKTH